MTKHGHDSSFVITFAPKRTVSFYLRILCVLAADTEPSGVGDRHDRHRRTIFSPFHR